MSEKKISQEQLDKIALEREGIVPAEMVQPDDLPPSQHGYGFREVGTHGEKGNGYVPAWDYAPEKVSGLIPNRATGLKKETLTIIAGRPGMGKSAFVTNIAVNIVKSGKSCLFVSLEMSKSDLARRILASECGIDSKKIETGALNDDEWSLITLGIKRLHGLPLFFEGAKSDTVQKIRAKAKEMQREPRGLDLVVVDSLQLITGSNKENRTQEISEISHGLKLLAMELKIPIIALSQLNRSVESRGNKRPLMSDLRESGGIEQGADNIIFIYRDEVYNENSDE